MDIPAKDLPLAENIRECQEECGKTYVTAEYTYGLKEIVFIIILKRYCSIVKLESIGKDRTMDLPLYCAVFDKNDSCVPCPYNSFNNFLYVFTFVFY